MAKRKQSTPIRALRQQAQRQDLELHLAESRYATQMYEQLQIHEARIAALQDPDEHEWIMTSSGGSLVDAKDFPEANRDSQRLRQLTYQAWRKNPHARGIIRSMEKFVIGREFGMDFADQRPGEWNPDRTKLVVLTPDPEDRTQQSLVRLLWEDFCALNGGNLLFKEMVRRTFRDRDVYIRGFVTQRGFVLVRFVEPENIQAPTGRPPGGLSVQAGDLPPDLERVYGPDEFLGKSTVIRDGIECLGTDSVTVVAYWVSPGEGAAPVRVPARQMIHIKPFADANDLHGIHFLEVLLRNISNYTTWEEYRMILNKYRSAVVLHRSVAGTATQAQTIIAGRASGRPNPQGREPATGSARREVMPAAGTIFTTPPGVTYEFKNPNLAAADAEHDGRRMLLTVAAGSGLPEGIVTADWSNNSYASSVEGRTPAVREWEDWQEFFETPIRRIWDWVREAGIKSLGVPEDTNPKVTIQWPNLVTQDAMKETERNMLLHQGGILSKRTLAAREDLVWEDELENLRQEAEEAGTTADPDTEIAAPPPRDAEEEGERPNG